MFLCFELVSFVSESVMQWQSADRTATKHVLLIESDPDDARRIRDALETAESSIRLHVAADGAGAVRFAERSGHRADAPVPDLVVLDPDLPESDGYELLAALRDAFDSTSTPVIVLSGSDSAADIARSYELQANAYVRKPDDRDELASAVRSLGRFWLETARLPGAAGAGRRTAPAADQRRRSGR